MHRNKRKPYFSNSTKKKKICVMQTGLKGFLCTCNGFEKNCVAESYNILNEYYDRIYGQEEVNISEDPLEESSSGDIADEFQKEVNDMKKSKYLRFKVLDTGVPNCIFIKTQVEDPVILASFILKDLELTKQKKTRYLMRMVPVEVTCKAYLDDIKKCAGNLIEKHFKTDATTFSIIYNSRHNSNLKRMEVITELADLITAQNEAHKVDLSNSKLTMIVEVMKGVCCLAVVPEYFTLCKYNLHLVTGCAEESEIGSSCNIQDEEENETEKSITFNGKPDVVITETSEPMTIEASPSSNIQYEEESETEKSVAANGKSDVAITETFE